jgi:hypothetical protein
VVVRPCTKCYNRSCRKTMNGARRTPSTALSALDMLQALRARNQCEGNGTNIII